MSLHDDFNGLKRQFEYLGYNDPGLHNRLREQLVSGTDHFTVRHREDNHPLTLICFFNISRGHINYHLLTGHPETTIFQGRLYPEITFFNRHIGQPNNKIFGARRYIYLNCYGNSLDTVNRTAKSFN